MHGNVKQWCKDWCNMDYYGESPLRDPQGPANGVARVVRGSSWDDGANGECRSAYREGSESGDNCIGFRVVMRVP
jgi:formylglycine-generating enzyme required for sulfatase activity